MSKLIVIEGIDGSGKGTQSRVLQERLKRENYDLFTLDFPQYKKDSSYFVRQYLSGQYGIKPEDVSPKQASICYGVDRFDYFKSNPEIQAAVANPDAVLLSNRYTTSNILYQATKAKSLDEIYELIDWICEFEYGILQIPEPDMVVMPHVDIEKNIEMMTRRDVAQTAQNNNMSKDIHEQDIAYLRRVSETSQIIAERMGFDIIDCMDGNGEIRSVQDIHEEIYSKVNQKVLRLVNTKSTQPTE